jgi:hypothetical protein
MLVSEIVLRRKFLKTKLDIIDRYINAISKSSSEIKGDLYTKAINEKFGLLSKIRSHDILLDDLNRGTVINIDDTNVSIYEALHLTDTLEEKINTFKAIIDRDNSKSLDAFALLDKIDIIFEEYINIHMAILSSDILTDWEK